MTDPTAPAPLPVPATLLGIVSCYSPSRQEAPAVEWLVSRMSSLGFTRSFRDEAGNAVGIMGTGERQIVLLGHIDTVPGEIPIALRDGNLYGRGSVDAKGPLAAFVDAVARLGPVDGWQIAVIGCVEEEGDSTGARFAAGQYHPKYAVIGEPSRWDRLTLGYKGSACAEISFRRPLAHSAGPDGSASDAVFAAWQSVLTWIAGFNQGHTRAFDCLIPTLRGIESGNDGFAEWAILRTSLRLPLDLSPQNWYARLTDLVAGCDVKPLGYAIPAYQGEKNNPLVRAFLGSLRANGATPGFVNKTGTADLNIVAPAWDCPALAYGPGDSSLDHSPDEHLEIAEYDHAVDVLHGMLARLLADNLKTD